MLKLKASKLYFYMLQEFQPTKYVLYTTQILKNPIYTNESASFSVIISLAEFMAINFDGLIPPSFIDYQDQFKLQNIWAEQICKAVISDEAYRSNDNILHVKIKIDSQYGAILIQNGFHKQQKVERIIQQDEISMDLIEDFEKDKRKNIFLLLCNHSAGLYNRHRIDLQALYIGIFYQNNQKWKIFRILEGKIPSKDQLLTADTIIIPGSNASISELNQNIEILKQKLLIVIKQKPDIKYLGICFGMQFLAHLFDGKVRKATQKTQKIQKITITFPKNTSKYLSPLKKKNNQILLSEYHSDQVFDLPQNIFDTLGYSPSCSNQLIISKHQRWIGIQSHPDYTPAYLQNYERKLNLISKNTKNKQIHVSYSKKNVDQQNSTSSSSSTLQSDSSQQEQVKNPINKTDQHQIFRQCIREFLQLK